MQQVETVVEGLVFPEGPVAMGDGAILVVDTGASTVVRIDRFGHMDVVAVTGGGPNGAALGPDGLLYVCNNGGGLSISRVDGRLRMQPAPENYSGGKIQRVDLSSGTVITLYDACEGLPLIAPNDIVFDREGGFWFTDSGQDTGGVYRKGALYYARADGSSIVCARSGLWYPNGVGLSPDGTKLCWASTITGRVFLEDIRGGELLTPTVGWSRGVLLHNVGTDELLDSLAVEADGRICVARVGGGIRIVAPDGDWDDVPLGDTIITNICFGGPDMRDAWITAAGSGRILKCRWPRPGLRLTHQL